MCNQPPSMGSIASRDQQLPCVVQNTPFVPDAPVEGDDDDNDNVITKSLSWKEQIELLESQQNAIPLEILAKHLKGEKLPLTKSQWIFVRQLDLLFCGYPSGSHSTDSPVTHVSNTLEV